jgi:DHA1 family bicyclomycin/chloramphenicol resistance-like MFS transporter
MVFSLAPVIAPSIGGWMLLFGGWRAIYVTLAAAGLLLAGFAARGLAETRVPAPRSGGFYLPVLRQPRTIGYAISSALNGGGVLAFVTGSPLVLMEGMRLTPSQFALAFAVVSSGIVTGAAVNARLVARGVPPVWPLGAGLGAALAAALGLCALAWFGRGGLPAMIPLLLLTTFCRGMISPNATHAVLERVPQHAGAASAVLGALQMLAGAVAGSLVGVLYPVLGSGAMGVTMAGFAFASLAVWLLTEAKG